MARLIAALWKIFNTWFWGQVYLPEPTSDVVLPPPHLSKIPVWALAIQHQEGGKSNDRNTKCFNPGNLKFTPYTKSLGAMTHDNGNFCIFPDYRTGFAALCQFLRDAASNKLKAYRSTMSLDSFTTIYAQPPNKNYVTGVAEALNVSINTPIHELL